VWQIFAVFVKIPSQMLIDGPVVLGDVRIFKYVAISRNKNNGWFSCVRK